MHLYINKAAHPVKDAPQETKRELSVSDVREVRSCTAYEPNSRLGMVSYWGCREYYPAFIALRNRRMTIGPWLSPTERKTGVVSTLTIVDHGLNLPYVIVFVKYLYDTENTAYFMGKK